MSSKITAICSKFSYRLFLPKPLSPVFCLPFATSGSFLFLALITFSYFRLPLLFFKSFCTARIFFWLFTQFLSHFNIIRPACTCLTVNTPLFISVSFDAISVYFLFHIPFNFLFNYRASLISSYLSLYTRLIKALKTLT